MPVQYVPPQQRVMRFRQSRQLPRDPRNDCRLTFNPWLLREPGLLGRAPLAPTIGSRGAWTVHHRHLMTLAACHRWKARSEESSRQVRHGDGGLTTGGTATDAGGDTSPHKHHLLSIKYLLPELPNALTPQMKSERSPIPRINL
ncbi:hypothetical protein J6590_038505 [Homalodisca vitripennis]|nr:hypothetical protein J6590_038505 [Homalodisca vitripennis]